MLIPFYRYVHTPENSSLAYHGVSCYSNIVVAQSSFLYPYNYIKGDLISVILIGEVWLTSVLHTHFCCCFSFLF